MVARPLPKWATKKYAKLWNKFKSKEFTYEQASNLLKEKNQNLVSVLFTYLRKFGWMKIRLHPIDIRKRIYQLEVPEKVIEEMGRGDENE